MGCLRSNRFVCCNCRCLNMQCQPATQVLSNDAVTAALDLWALGCIIYQMLVGKAPFKAASEYLTFQLIADASYSFPAHPALPPAAEDIIRRLLVVDAGARLGACACLQPCISAGLLLMIAFNDDVRPMLNLCDTPIFLHSLPFQSASPAPTNRPWPTKVICLGCHCSAVSRML